MVIDLHSYYTYIIMVARNLYIRIYYIIFNIHYKYIYIYNKIYEGELYFIISDYIFSLKITNC